uniref:Uncharacterized protein n=1 Tax=Oryza punctata TaxID=4537 RepID=A0A0E0KPL1_ORYPU
MEAQPGLARPNIVSTGLVTGELSPNKIWGQTSFGFGPSSPPSPVVAKPNTAEEPHHPNIPLLLSNPSRPQASHPATTPPAARTPTSSSPPCARGAVPRFLDDESGLPPGTTSSGERRLDVDEQEEQAGGGQPGREPLILGDFHPLIPSARVDQTLNTCA